MVRRNVGFTLLELALTLGIMGMIAGAILVPFVSQIAQRNVAATEKLLEEAKEALIGFAVARGRLPCPATAASNGVEQFDTANGGNAVNGDCLSDFGFLPAVTLGFSPVNNQGYAIDAFGGGDVNRIRYAVWTGTVAGVQWAFTKEGGMRTATASELSKAWLFHVCSTGTSVSGAPPL
jgi:type II secretory pathway pseudopilin PulG